jgi:serine phosphatase RsbU (regulator of sigma subunit)/FixJ family two-component response regulator
MDVNFNDTVIMPDAPLARVLIVDDEAAQTAALCETLRAHRYAVTGFTSPRMALDALRLEEFDLVLTDLMMPEIDGIALLGEAQKIDRNIVAIIMTGHATIDSAVEAMKVGAIDYVVKPFKLGTLLPMMARALDLRRLRMENVQLRETVAIYELSMTIASARDSNAILQNLANAAFGQSDDGEVSILVSAEDARELEVSLVRGDKAAELVGRRARVDQVLSNWVKCWQEIFSSSEAAVAMRLAREHPFHALTTGIALPMLAGGKLIGVLTFASGQTSRPISLGMVKTLNILGSAAASALANAQMVERLELRVFERTAELQAKSRQIEEELRMAQELQIAMLPHRFPSVPRDVPLEQSAVRFYSVYRPAGSVSGDFFDVIALSDGSVGVFIGDVMGHDVRAALITAMMRALVQELSATLPEPGSLLEELNRHLIGILRQADPIMFATASYLVVNPERSQLLYANAGHPVPIHLHRDRHEALPIGRKGDCGPALGLFGGATYNTYSYNFAAGDCIMLFTDGLFEVEDDNQEIYSQERLQGSISRQLDLTAEDLLNGLFTDIRQFSGEREFEDDVCLVAIEVTRFKGTAEHPDPFMEPRG